MSYSCKRITADDIECYDLIRFEELREEFEPLETDFSEDNARMAYAESDENRRWVRIELTSLGRFLNYF
ncbi:hypothetical protein DRP05_13320 [Archaeoglobales archaeon]|nr:MAG: hypothetical protein DRP05_13320 [Archaeoglobales archaeon]